MKRLAVLHTVGFLMDRFKALLAERYPGLDSFHMVDESLLQEALAQGGLTSGIVRRVVQQACLARDAGAQAVLFTCSSTSPAVDVARQVVDVPIIKIDDAMAQRAVELGARIGLMCTARSTLEPSRDIITSHAARQGKEVTVTPVLEAAAFDALRAGKQGEHDDLLRAAVKRLATECDVVVLAQASMAHLVEDLNASLQVPVLASPALCVDSLAGYIADSGR